MPPPYNTFDAAVKKAFIKVFNDNIGSLSQNIVGSDTIEPDVLPRVIVAVTDMEEIIFNTGNYRARVEITLKTNIGNQLPTDSETLFASVLDVLQTEDFNQQMTDTGFLIVQGSVIQQMTPAVVEDQMWVKKLEIDIFGLSNGG